MSHVEPVRIDFDQVLRDTPIAPSAASRKVLWSCFVVGLLGFVIAAFTQDPQHVWGAYFTNMVFWMGLAAGGTVGAVIFQIVRAKWAAPVRRIAEANVAYLPWAWLALVVSYIGAPNIYSWFHSPMPGREWWMQPTFVYLRFALLFGLLFFLLIRFVKLSVRGDLGLIKEKGHEAIWRGWLFNYITRGWKGSTTEVPALHRRMSVLGPIIIVVYAVVYTLFMTEMVGGIDLIWYANMFGGFNFIGNIYIGWAVLIVLTTYLSSRKPNLKSAVSKQQYWDLGKLLFGFCMLWGYLFFSHFLPQWYGNMPEETQWLILRTREFPWKGWSWVTFSMCFVFPFIVLISRDLKRTPKLLSAVALVILVGVWTEKYVVIMPNFSAHEIPFNWIEISTLLMFFGVYGLSILGFMSRLPYLAVSHPMSRGETAW